MSKKQFLLIQQKLENYKHHPIIPVLVEQAASLSLVTLDDVPVGYSEVI